MQLLLPVGCSLWTRFLISVLRILLASTELEQVRVGQDDVHVTNLSGAAHFLQLLHVSSGNQKYFIQVKPRLKPTVRESTSPRPRCLSPPGQAGRWWRWCTPPQLSRLPDTLCHDPDQHDLMMN